MLYKRKQSAVAIFRAALYNSVMTQEDRQRINALIVHISQGDVYALDALSRLVSGRMFSVALSFVKNRSLAEDVVQDSFVNVMQNAAQFSPNTNGYAWICKIVQNTALNALRKEKRFKAENIDDFFDLSDSFDLAEQSAATVTLQRAMSVLNSLEKLLIYQKYFMDFTVRDIAKSVGKPKSTVQRTLNVAENKMRIYLESRKNNET